MNIVKPYRFFLLLLLLACSKGKEVSSTINNPTVPVVVAPKITLPTVAIADTPTSFSSTNLVYNAKILDNGGEGLTNYGICWSKNSSPTLNDFKYNYTGNLIGNFETNVQGLKGGTVYNFASYATNSAGTNYSTIKTVKTPDPINIVNCQLPEMLTRGDVGIGFPRIANRMKSVGTLTINVIFVDFSDAASTKTPQEVYSILTPTAETYFNTVSYGKLNIQFKPNLKWYRMAKPSSDYGWDNLTFNLHKQYIQEAINLADADIDFSGSDAFIIIANPDATKIKNGPAFTASKGAGIKVDGKEFLSSATSGNDLKVWGGLWFNHEFGHDMSLVDLYAYQGNAHRFVGEYSIMGLISGAGQDLFGWEKWILGWLSDDQVVCVNSGVNSALLTPIETAGGTKLFTMPISKTAAIVVESRRAIGYDKNLPKTGPLVYIVDTNIPSGTGTIKVLPIDETDIKKLQSPMVVGQVMNYLNYSIKFVSTDSNGDVVEIKKN